MMTWTDRDDYDQSLADDHARSDRWSPTLGRYRDDYDDAAADAAWPLDVWLRHIDDEEEAEAEANTYRDGDGFRVDWYLNSVGLVTSVSFATYQEARDWLASEGFADFTS